MKTILLTAIAVVIPVVALAQSATPANPPAADVPPPVSAPLIDQMATGAVEVPRRILGALEDEYSAKNGWGDHPTR